MKNLKLQTLSDHRTQALLEPITELEIVGNHFKALLGLGINNLKKGKKTK